MHTADREFANGFIASYATQESIGNKVDLKLTVRISAHQISYTDNFSIQTDRNRFQYSSFRKEFCTDIFVCDILSDIEVILSENP